MAPISKFTTVTARMYSAKLGSIIMVSDSYFLPNDEVILQRQADAVAEY